MPVASFLLVMLLAALQARPDFRADVKVVRVDTEVSADARPVDGLTKEDFRVSDEGKLVEIVYFGHAEEPLDIILVFDTSASMLPAIERVAEVSRAALGELRSDDRVAVMAFDKDTDLIADFTSDFDRVQTVVQDDVLRRTFVPVSQIQPAAYDAARHFLRQPRSNRRRAVVFITDNIGTSREKRALPALWEADAVVGGVVVPGVDMTSRLPVPASWLNSSNISDIAQRTGGEAVKVDDPGRAFRQMIQRMRLR
jgi:VWFA-related protein